MTTEILALKEAAGPAAFLWLHTGGDCILWPSESASEGDAGAAALARWQLEPSEVDALIATGEVDEVC